MNTLTYILNSLEKDIRGTGPYEIFNYGRNKMLHLFKELNFKIGAEIGVCDGEFSEIMCQTIPGLKLYGVDPWIPYPEYTDHRLKRSFRKMVSETTRKLAPFDFTMIRKFSMDALIDIENETLDFVYIDANHEFPFVLDDIVGWSKKVKRGGIVAGHDYDRVSKSRLRINWGVSDAVLKYIKDEKTGPLFILGTLEKVEGNEMDSARSWMFVKQ